MVTKNRIFVTFSLRTATLEIIANLSPKTKNSKGEEHMKSIKAWAVAVAVLMAFALAFTAEARPFGPKRGIKSGLVGLKGFLELNLSAGQQEEMLNILNKYQLEREGLRDRIMESRKNLRAVLRAEAFNEGEARKAFREASAAREDIFVLRAKMMSELKAVLTPEQKQLIESRRGQRAEKMRQRVETLPENPSQ
jgi:Spy/CpxP family protein refolding chaperone